MKLWKERKKMSVKLNKGEMKEPEWWCRHHKDNVSYLCVIIRRMMKAHDENNTEELATTVKMMHSQLPAFEEVSRL